MNNFNDTVLASLPSGRVRVGVLGAAGYTGGELIRLLLNHPEAEIVFANSESNPRRTHWRYRPALHRRDALR